VFLFEKEQHHEQEEVEKAGEPGLQAACGGSEAG
jgi:hypothetical protein